MSKQKMKWKLERVPVRKEQKNKPKKLYDNKGNEVGIFVNGRTALYDTPVPKSPRRRKRKSKTNKPNNSNAVLVWAIGIIAIMFIYILTGG